jgi:hypothetical protein
VEAGSFELLAASLRADARDLDAFFEALAGELSAAFPETARIERKGFRGGGWVRAIDLDLGEHRYRLAESGGARGTRGQTVLGLQLRR